MHKKNIIYGGLKEGTKALVMIHGRGGSAEDILSLATYFKLDDFMLLAPQATGNTWYPASFLAPASQNEPWLSSALYLLKAITGDLMKKGISSENMYFLGFSQGACLMLEFAARNARKYGGIAAFTGGLIGQTINRGNYKGDFMNTPVFIGSSDPDPHVPVERVYASSNILRDMNADVTEKIYANMGHTINQDEINMAGDLIFRV